MQTEQVRPFSCVWICGILKPTSGTIRLGQYDVTDSGYRNLLGYLPQDFGYYPEFTGMEKSVKKVRDLYTKEKNGG